VGASDKAASPGRRGCGCTRELRSKRQLPDLFYSLPGIQTCSGNLQLCSVTRLIIRHMHMHTLTRWAWSVRQPDMHPTKSFSRVLKQVLEQLLGWESSTAPLRHISSQITNRRLGCPGQETWGKGKRSDRHDMTHADRVHRSANESSAARWTASAWSTSGIST
jgi:hypothetical protein